MSESIRTLLANLEDEKLLEEVKRQLKTQPPLAIIDDLKQGLTEVGDRFETGEYFLSDLVFAADMFQQVNELLEPQLVKDVKEIKGSVVIGTVEGDFHDIGKNIIISLLRSNGYKVEDLGKDVTPEQFMKAVKRLQPDILGMSGLLTTSLGPMKKTIELVKKEYKEKLVIIVGGAPISERWVQEAGADFGTNNAAIGIKMINEVLQKAEISAK